MADFAAVPVHCLDQKTYTDGRSGCCSSGPGSKALNVQFTFLFMQVGFRLTVVYAHAELQDGSKSKQYVYALFISTSHLFCLGYGLASMPGTFVELCVTLISMIVGSVLFLVVVGTLPTVILESEVSAAAQELEGDHVPLPGAR